MNTEHYEIGEKLIILPFKLDTFIGSTYMAGGMDEFIGKEVIIKDVTQSTQGHGFIYRLKENHYAWPHDVLLKQDKYKSYLQLVSDFINKKISIIGFEYIKNKNEWK